MDDGPTLEGLRDYVYVMRDEKGGMEDEGQWMRNEELGRRGEGLRIMDVYSDYSQIGGVRPNVLNTVFYSRYLKKIFLVSQYFFKFRKTFFFDFR